MQLLMAIPVPVSLPAAKYTYCAVAYATACMHAFLAEICIQGTLLQKNHNLQIKLPSCALALAASLSCGCCQSCTIIYEM